MRTQHLYIYTGDREPEDRKAFLWLTRDDTRSLVLKYWNGDKWESVATFTGSEETVARLIDKLQEMTDDAARLITSLQNPPIIGQDGYWYFWNPVEQRYVSSGVSASVPKSFIA